VTEAHQAGALLVLTLSVVALAWAGAAVVLRRDPGRFFVANAVWIVILLGLTSIAGGAVALGGRPPTDPLHLVYGALALAAWPFAALVGRGRDIRGKTLVAAICALVALILVLRVMGTGG
jgi:hypothetical protein